jgi:hypothetical protein
MRKFALKTLFSIAAAIMLNACIAEPVNIRIFLEDEKVQEVIERGRERVYLIDNTGDNLVAASGRITGLRPDKYYMVEEQDESKRTVRTGFVSAQGLLSLDLLNIGRVTEGEIRNLTNFFTYIVDSASPLTGEMMIYDLANPPTSTNTGTPVPATSSGLSLKYPNYTYYLDLTETITSSTWEAVMVPVSSDESNKIVNLTSPIKLEEEGSTTDYVFFNSNSMGFRVLRVSIGERANANIISVTFDINDIGNTLSLSSNTISQAFLAGGGTVTITITSTDTAFNANATTWRLGSGVGAINHTGNPLTITSANLPVLVRGINDISVEVYRTGSTEPYSGKIPITVNQ